MIYKVCRHITELTALLLVFFRKTLGSKELTGFVLEHTVMPVIMSVLDDEEC